MSTKGRKIFNYQRIYFGSKALSATDLDLAAGAEFTTTVTVPKARQGDPVCIGLDLQDADLIVSGYVSADNTVTVTVTNTHASAASAVGAATLNVIVFGLN